MTHDQTDGEEKTEPGSQNGEARSDSKKERVLHTRIPALLEAELKAAAAGLRIPVSNLVRTILEDAVAMADRATGRVESSLERAARSVHAERERLRSRVRRFDPLENVVAYQSVIVAVETSCAKCGAVLEQGDDAALAVRDRPGPKLFVCTGCMPRRGQKPEPEETSS